MRTPTKPGAMNGQDQSAARAGGRPTAHQAGLLEWQRAWWNGAVGVYESRPLLGDREASQSRLRLTDRELLELLIEAGVEDIVAVPSTITDTWQMLAAKASPAGPRIPSMGRGPTQRSTTVKPLGQQPDAIHPNEDAPRVEPCSMEEMRPEWLSILERIPGAGLKGQGFPRHVLGAIMHNPDTMETFLDYWVTAKSKMGLSVREQELVILRMACLYNSDYVWKHHVPVGREFAITEAELKAVHDGVFSNFQPREQALLALTDELIDYRSIRRAIWERYHPALNNRDLVDLISLLSQYVFFALLNNALQVQVEEGVAAEPSLADF
jgi:4-carboxymuconolactone decarboxylase